LVHFKHNDLSELET